MSRGCADKFPLLLDGRAEGELTVEREALYTWFNARCRLPEEGGLWCAWAVGQAGSLRLGVLEPVGQAVLHADDGAPGSAAAGGDPACGGGGPGDVAGRAGGGDAVSRAMAA